MEVRAEILEALHNAAVDVDEVSKQRRHGKIVAARGWTSLSAGQQWSNLAGGRRGEIKGGRIMIEEGWS